MDLIKHKRFLNQLFPKLKAQNIDLNSVHTDFRWYYLFPFGVPASDRNHEWTICLCTRTHTHTRARTYAHAHMRTHTRTLGVGLAGQGPCTHLPQRSWYHTSAHAPPGLCLQAQCSVPFKCPKHPNTLRTSVSLGRSLVIITVPACLWKPQGRQESSLLGRLRNRERAPPHCGASGRSLEGSESLPVGTRGWAGGGTGRRVGGQHGTWSRAGLE